MWVCEWRLACELCSCWLQVLIAESYGGHDEPVDTLTNNFVGVGVEPVLEAFRVREVPDEATYQVRLVVAQLPPHSQHNSYSWVGPTVA